MKKITYSLSRQLITDLTPEVEAFAAEANLKNGAVVLEASSSTACLFRLDAQIDSARFAQDLFRETTNIVPSRITFSSIESPATTAGMLKGAMFGRTLTVLVEDGTLVFPGKVWLADFCAPQAVTVAFCAVCENGGK